MLRIGSTGQQLAMDSPATTPRRMSRLSAAGSTDRTLQINSPRSRISVSVAQAENVDSTGASTSLQSAAGTWPLSSIVLQPPETPLASVSSSQDDVGPGHSQLQGPGIPAQGNRSPKKGPALVVFSGGTAFNSVAGRLRKLTTRVTYVLPVSDDGGSTAEIVRVLGGPAVGDIRSRCLRLADESDEEGKAVKALLAHRLSSSDPHAAKHEWYRIVEGQHPLWQGVSEPYKHVIRAFLVHFNTMILSHSSLSFDFSNGSIGNFFFAGSRTFFRSLEAAVFLFSRVARIPEGCKVVPAICTEERITLGAELEDGTVIKGQNQISHPSAPGRPSSVDKTGNEPLPAPIRRVFYLSSEGQGREHEVLPAAHPAAVAEINKCDGIIYGMGSLYTSICPTICLDGMGEAIAVATVPKILLLNGSHDRETASSGAHDGPMTAADIVQAVCDSLNRRRNRQGQRLRNPPAAYVTGLLVPRGSAIKVDQQALQLLGVRHVLEVESVADGASGVLYDEGDLVRAIEVMLKLMSSERSSDSTFQQPPEIPAAVASVDSA